MDEIENLRRQIDHIDYEIIDLLDRRIAIAEKIGDLKAETGIEVEDEEREEIVLTRAGEYRRVFNSIIYQAKKAESRLIDDRCCELVENKRRSDRDIMDPDRRF
ncbi:MAG: chorismate mutase [Thermoplasmata archaeon]